MRQITYEAFYLFCMQRLYSAAHYLYNYSIKDISKYPFGVYLDEIEGILSQAYAESLKLA